MTPEYFTILREDMKAGFDRMDKRFDEMNGRVRVNETDIAVHGEQLKEHDSDINRLWTRLRAHGGSKKHTTIALAAGASSGGAVAGFLTWLSKTFGW